MYNDRSIIVTVHFLVTPLPTTYEDWVRWWTLQGRPSDNDNEHCRSALPIGCQ